MNIIRRYWRIALPIIVMIIIWIFSSINGAASEANSMAVAGFLGIPNFIVRKLAHVLLFGILGFTWAVYMKNRYIDVFPSVGSIVFSVILVLCYAIIDELHQYYVPGREALPIDVLLDTLSGLGGALLYTSIFSFRYRRLLLKKNKK